MDDDKTASAQNAKQSGGLRNFEWIAIIALFLLTGIFGHDPWKQDETYSFGIIYHFYLSHDWLVPMNAGVPFMEKPPLYYWTAALLCRVFSGVLALPDAARLTSSLYMLISCLAVWNAARVLFDGKPERRALCRITLGLFLGCFGLARHAHDMFTDMALLSGASVTLWGMALLILQQEKWLRAGLLLGVGLGIAFLSKGLLVPVILCASGFVLFILLPQVRTRQTGYALLVALLASSPFLFIWPLLLYQHSPDLFIEWFWDNNIGRFLGFSVKRLGAGNKHHYIFQTIWWFAFPAFPLAVAAAVIKRREWRTPVYILPFTIAVVGLIILSVSASARALYILPLLPAFALLAAQALTQISAKWQAGWNLAVRVIAGIASVLIVVMWVCLLNPEGPQPFKRLYGEWLPLGFLPQHTQWVACFVATLVVALWFVTLRLKGRTGADTATIWLAGVALLWGLGNTLLMPWVDETRSFQPVIRDLNTFLSQPAYADACVARFSLGESVSPMWQYFGQGRGMGPMEDFSGNSCPLLLLMTGKSMAPLSDPRWHLIWKGSRLLDSKDELQLYQRNDAPLHKS